MVKEVGNTAKEIVKIVNELAKLEKDKEETSIKIARKGSEKIGEFAKYLDTMARLLAIRGTKEVCGSVFFDDSSISEKKRFLFATNTRMSEGAAEYVSKLKKFIIDVNKKVKI